MNLLLLNQFYPPDVAPTGQFLHDVARGLVARGHRVTVLCSRRSYGGSERFPARHTLDGVEVVRIAAPGYGRRSFLGKLADYAGFAAGLVLRVLSERPRPDLILSLTTPPFLGLAARGAAAVRGCRHAHWIMDVYPDVMAAHGLIAGNEQLPAASGQRPGTANGELPAASGQWPGTETAKGELAVASDERTEGARASEDGGLAWRVLSALARAELRGSALTLTLGPAIARKVERYADGPVAWVPLWGPFASGAAADGGALRAERGWPVRRLVRGSPKGEGGSPEGAKEETDDLVLMYSGNMGLGHRFTEFLEAARRMGPASPARWAFCGGGARRGEVEAFARAHPGARVELHPYVARERLGEALAAGDVHLASLDAAWQGLMVPSKIQGIFAAARPVIFVGGGDNEIAGWIREAGAGWVVAENDVDGLLAAVEEARDEGERAERGAAARRFADGHFDRDTNVARICGMVERAAKG